MGRARIEAIATSGRRPEHLALLVSDADGGRTALLSGDSLLVGDVARPDLAVPGADGAQAMWSTLRRRERLDDEVEVWPAHVGGSLCSSGSGSLQTSSTIGAERNRNRGLLAPDYATFIDGLLAALPARHPCVDRVVYLNRTGATRPAPLSLVDPHELRELVTHGAYVLDGRSPEEFDAGHIAGALNLPAVGRESVPERGGSQAASRPLSSPA